MYRRHSISIRNCRCKSAWKCVCYRFTFILVMVLSHFLYLVVFHSHLCPANQPTHQNEYFLTVVVAKLSTWILHQHKGNIRSLSLSLVSTSRKRVCVIHTVYVYKSNIFSRPLLHFSSYLCHVFSVKCLFAIWIIMTSSNIQPRQQQQQQQRQKKQQ